MAISKVKPPPDLAKVMDADGRIDKSWLEFMRDLRKIVNDLVDNANS